MCIHSCFHLSDPNSAHPCLVSPSLCVCEGGLFPLHFLPWLSDTDIWYVGGWQMLVIAGKLCICMWPPSQDFQIDNKGKSLLLVLVKKKMWSTEGEGRSLGRRRKGAKSCHHTQHTVYRGKWDLCCYQQSVFINTHSKFDYMYLLSHLNECNANSWSKWTTVARRS